jgi:predicted lysophospholipase L1 biosynthesis ABC-type transport system permease subunit
MSNKAIPITDHDAARSARNRKNASRSTGPKTEAGKHRSSLNALRHGLTGHTIVLPAEDLDAYNKFTQQFFDELKPVGLLEKQFVQLIAGTSWRLIAEGSAMAIGGLAVGFACGIGLAQLAGAFLGDLKMPGVLPVAGSALALLLAAATASVIPAARAARVDVMQALRTD